MITEKIAYTLDGTDFEGVLVYDDSVTAPRPAVVVAPNWMGVSEAAVSQTEMLAGEASVMLVADMYGVDVRPTNMEEAAEAATAVRADIPMMRRRINKALEVLLAEGGRRGIIDAARTAAIGFCFGGGNVLELARGGGDVKGIVSFHGSLTTAHPEDARNIKAKVLILHGADDPAAPKADRDSLEAELTAAGVDWQIVAFGGAVHSFTDPGANIPGANQYDQKTATRAYKMMDDFFAEIF